MTNDPDRAEKPKDRKEQSRKLGTQLRRLYDDVASEPVPDDFLKLLDDADEQASDGNSDQEG